MDNDNKNSENCQTAITFSVYVIFCNYTGKFYVGVTRQPVTTRIRQHKRGQKRFIDLEIQKIGWENVDWWVVEEHIPAEKIYEREKYRIKYFDCVHPKGYKKTHGGIGHIEVTEDTRAKIRQLALERDYSGEKNPFYGKCHTPETIEKNRQAHIGQPAWNKGKKLTEEQKAKMRETRAANKAKKEKAAQENIDALKNADNQITP